MKRALVLVVVATVLAVPLRGEAATAVPKRSLASTPATKRSATPPPAPSKPPPRSVPAAAAPNPTPAPIQIGTTPAAAPVRPMGIMEEESRFYRYKLVTSIGLHLLQTSAVAISGQYGIAFKPGVPWYIGPDIGFSLFSPGHALVAMVSSWYELRVFGSPRLAIGLGGAGGAAFTGGLARISSVTYALYLDAFLAQDIDDLSTIRLQFRPGLLGNYFSFLMNFNVAFRFL